MFTITRSHRGRWQGATTKSYLKIRRGGATQPAAARAVLQQAARDHEALDLARPLVDLHHARVAVEALDGVLLHVAVAAMDLDRLVRHPGRGLAGVELRHRRLARVGLAGVLEPCRALDQEPRALDAALHLRELELHRLDLRERLAERLAQLGVAHRLLERRGHHAQRLGAHADPPGVQHAHRDPEALALVAQPLIGGHLQIFERERDGVRAAQAHLVLGVADHEPLGAALDDEGRESPVARGLVGAREDQVDAGLLAVRDPVLAAVQQVRVALPHRGGLDRGGVGARAGLAERERGQLPRDQAWQEAPALHVVAEAEHRQRAHRVVHRDHDRERGRDPRDLLQHHHDGARVVADAAPFLGDRHAEEALLCELRDRLARHDPLVVPAGRVRGELALAQLPHRVAHRALVFREIEVHAGMVSSLSRKKTRHTSPIAPITIAPPGWSSEPAAASSASG
jgi:hypothetical protein